MLSQFESHLHKNFPQLWNEKFLIAISGGIDSVVLAHLCHELSLDFALAHCNFQLRGEDSDKDENFVKALGKQWGVEVFVKRFDTREGLNPNTSIQLVARDLRYAWFKELCEKLSISYVLTAHHLNDDMETFFINLLRGSGLEGLTGIPAQNEQWLRPLLPFSKSQLKAFALQKGITWREDVSNATDDYLRNRIRHKLLPLLEEENPDFENSFRLTQNHLEETKDLVGDYMDLLKKDLMTPSGEALYYDVQKLKNLPHPRAVLYEIFKEYGFTAWEDIYKLLEAQSGKWVASPNFRLLRDRDFLVLMPQKKIKKPEIQIGKTDKMLNFAAGKLILKNVINVTKKTPEISYLAADKLTYPLKLRIWKPGDKFKPLGMKGHKKISDFLTDEKLNLFEKENTWVLCSGNRIAWVLGHRISEDFKIENHRSKILKIEWIK